MDILPNLVVGCYRSATIIDTTLKFCSMIGANVVDLPGEVRQPMPQLHCQESSEIRSLFSLACSLQLAQPYGIKSWFRIRVYCSLVKCYLVSRVWQFSLYIVATPTRAERLELKFVPIPSYIATQYGCFRLSIIWHDSNLNLSRPDSLAFALTHCLRVGLLILIIRGCCNVFDEIASAQIGIAYLPRQVHVTYHYHGTHLLLSNPPLRAFQLRSRISKLLDCVLGTQVVYHAYLITNYLR